MPSVVHRNTNEAREWLARIQIMWAELHTLQDGTSEYDALVVLIRATAEAFKARFSSEHPNVLVRISERLSTRST